MTELATPSLPIDSGTFLEQAFSQIETTVPAVRTVAGPHLATFQAHREAVQANVKAIDPRLDIPNLWNPDYRPPEVVAVAKQIEAEREACGDEGNLTGDLWRIKIAWSGTLNKYAHEVIPTHATQRLTPGVLDVPPYHAQGENGDYSGRYMSCSLAAYRMVFDGIANWVPPERDMAEQIRDRYGTVAVPDDVYIRLLSTAAFREATGKKVVTLMMPGADFEYITKWATKLKCAKKEPQVFAVADIGSLNYETGNILDFVTHRVVLQGTTKKHVVFHDPNQMFGKDRQLPRPQFVRRWASAHNMTRLIIAQDV